MKTIQYINRVSGKIEKEQVPAAGLIKFLYNNPVGKLSLKTLIKRKYVSVLMGKRMNGKRSRKKIQTFIEKNQINMNEFYIPKNGFKNFNQFFYRKLKNRTIRPVQEGVVSPADGRVLVFPKVKDTQNFFIKGGEFNLKTFFNSAKLSNDYKNGSLCIVRLAPADYHRFHFPVSGYTKSTRMIKGDYYSVSPLALKNSLKILLENKRTISMISTKNYGDVVLSEVGATLTGSIIQTYKTGNFVHKGDEKGYFAFGGSTLVLLFKENTIQFSEDLIVNTKKGYETLLKMGETLGNSPSLGL